MTASPAYGPAVELVEDHAPAGLVVDLGRGAGEVAGAVTRLGRTYVAVDCEGSDCEGSGCAGAAQPGFEYHRIEPDAGEALPQRLREILAGRPLGALLALDVLAGADADGVLARLRDVVSQHAGAILVVSATNVTSVEVAVKLLQGRWAPAGREAPPHRPPDQTPNQTPNRCAHQPVALYCATALRAIAARTGWAEVAGSDLALPPAEPLSPADDIGPSTPLYRLVASVRTQSGPHAQVARFVRAWAPAPPVPAPPVPARTPAGVAAVAADAPFLSVLTRTLGDRPETLEDTLLCLAAQTCTDFEVILLVHDAPDDHAARVGDQVAALPADVAARCRILAVSGGGRCRPLNVGIGAARGRYVAFVDDDDLVTGDWVEVFHELSVRGPGSVLRTGVASQEVASTPWPDRLGFSPVSGITSPFPGEFDMLDHVFENRSPLCGLAFPRSCFRHLGIRFDESLPVLEDWDILLQAGAWCGVTSGSAVTSLYRRWVKGGSMTHHDDEEWAAARGAVQAKVDRQPFLFPTGTASRVQALYDRAADAEHLANAASYELARRNEELAELDRYRKDLEVELEAYRRVQEELRRSLAEAEGAASRAAGEARRARADAERAAGEARSAERRRLEELHLLRQQFVSSASWRLTRPLRELGGLARRAAASRGGTGTTDGGDRDTTGAGDVDCRQRR